MQAATQFGIFPYQSYSKDPAVQPVAWCKYSSCESQREPPIFGGGEMKREDREINTYWSFFIGTLEAHWIFTSRLWRLDKSSCTNEGSSSTHQSERQENWELAKTGWSFKQGNRLAFCYYFPHFLFPFSFPFPSLFSLFLASLSFFVFLFPFSNFF